MSAAAFVLLTAPTHADGQAACIFSGTVRLDGAEVSDGTLVTAVVQGIEYHSHTPTGYAYSTYSITILPPEGKAYPDGAEVTFKINGHKADQRGVFKAGTSQRLDLTARTAAPAGGLDLKFLIGIVLALLVAAAAAYYLGRLRPARQPVRTPQMQYSVKGTVRPEKVQRLEAARQPPGNVVHLGQPAVIEPQELSKRTAIYSRGILRALEAHGVSPVGIPSKQKLVTCPGCGRQFTVRVPANWILGVKPHLADGTPSYNKRTYKKELFEVDVACSKGHGIHLDWDWITPPQPQSK